MIGKNKISGVVCEFNPLHNGHAALLSRISEEFGSDIVCVMSGNFVQRGEAAVLDKWLRTRLALQNGAALVLELPLPWAVAGAEKFALGGISLLNALGCVDTLTFGSETGDTAPLMHCAEYLHSDVFNSDIRPEVAKGVSEGDSVYVDIRLPAGLELNLNAAIFTDAFAAYCAENNVEIELVCAKRTNILCADGTAFE